MRVLEFFLKIAMHQIRKITYKRLIKCLEPKCVIVIFNIFNNTRVFLASFHFMQLINQTHLSFDFSEQYAQEKRFPSESICFLHIFCNENVCRTQRSKFDFQHCYTSVNQINCVSPQ